MTKILVTGATGGAGSQVVELLLRRVRAENIVALASGGLSINNSDASRREIAGLCPLSLRGAKRRSNADVEAARNFWQHVGWVEPFAKPISS
ncbi:MAG: hypothetical protein JWP25_796 [Bradyrhizobium sp.]|jgi:nucleoside-diphosphate-sugar epimerase|nr:hypothetical protein [Bradyrhizobium sp.]MEA2868154.1 hypothetical protein [Bradyrhizobium sp.]